MSGTDPNGAERTEAEALRAELSAAVRAFTAGCLAELERAVETAERELRKSNRPLSVDAWARLRQRSPRTLRAAIRAGTLRAHRTGRRGRWQIFPSDFATWERSDVRR